MKLSFDHKADVRFNSLPEAERAFNNLTRQLMTMKREVERGVANQSAVTINVGGIAGSSGGSSASSSGVTLRNKTESLTANVTKTVTFSSPFGAAYTIPSLRLIDSNGYALQDFSITNITAAGFDITAPADCSLYYLAVEET